MKTIRNRHTGKTKRVPDKVAEMCLNELFLSKDWEPVKEPSTEPEQVIKIESQDEQVTEQIEEINEKPEVTEAPDQTKTVEAPIQRSCKQLQACITVISEEEVRGYLTDERVTVKKMAEAELKRRKDG